MSLKQVDKNPGKHSSIRSLTSVDQHLCGICFDLQKIVHDKKKLVHSEYKREYCAKCLSDGIDPIKGQLYVVAVQGQQSDNYTQSKDQLNMT